MRTLEFEDVPASRSKEKGRATSSAPYQDSLGDGDGDDDDQELSEEQMRRLKTTVAKVFGVVIADESHKLKSV